MPKVNQFDNVWPVVINHTGDEKLWLSWFVPLKLQSAISSSEAEFDHSAVEVLHLPQSVVHIWWVTG